MALLLFICVGCVQAAEKARADTAVQATVSWLRVRARVHCLCPHTFVLLQAEAVGRADVAERATAAALDAKVECDCRCPVG